MSEAPPFEPVLINSSGELGFEIARRRYALGMSGEEVDYLAGVQDRYAAKLESPDAPWGRAPLHLTPPCAHVSPAGNIRLPSAADWVLEVLGLRVVLMTKEQADAIGARTPEPRKDPDARRAALAELRWAAFERAKSGGDS